MIRSKETPLAAVGDGVIVALAFAFAIFGVAMIYSAGEMEVPSSITGIWRKQAIWLVISLFLFVLTLRVSIRWLEWVAPLAYAAAILALIVVLIIGGGSGPRSWIRIGAVGFQPSEFAKLATILLLARLIANRERPPDNLWDLWPLVAAVLLPFGLILLEPDLGTASVFVAILIAAVFWSGLSLPKLLLFLSPLVSLALAFSTPLWGLWFLLLVAFLYLTRSYLTESLMVIFVNLAMGVLVLPAWRSLATYQKVRIMAFITPEADPQGAGWHLIQSQVAIGSGGWFGKGFLQGTQKRLAFLPEQHTDFIFAVVGEEFGFIGSALILLGFVLLLWRILRIAERTEDEFASMVTFGIFALWFAHIVANIGMTVGLLPITGLPLPFLSYGGSFLVISFICLAVVQRVAVEHRLGP
ncbi:MAG: rod shape-determining protein RodA [Gemmatimonadetes bacterium]|uniref:Rod shape-determining protein RodA n=1 Tax=Candidatus Kutchimonas denitrificans TaxID=3056748 RepID=A0AAE5CA73_9BACT|nr:rod shape-determining protein RodA [Gemmatimonadota bacterium]NIR76201.1 rod shape-determining protein RodA [Candidatus Kutchimonas denitrificans]NIS00641.1 rod shape-determining protein RodA [Gemmatimonadota bacterium]NIT66786.1 rod shape-determining protein RodA [Gemmatimonadota bacterium]NIV23385.1 rod shape-determining protein RodA [Gemmatimonadota bacterium]